MKHIKDVFEKSSVKMKSLTERSKNISMSEEIFYSCISSTIRKYLRLAKIVNDVIYVVVENSSTATRLIYDMTDILKNLKIHQEFKNIKKIRYVISQRKFISQNKKRNDHGITIKSQDNKNMILSTVNTIKNEQLKSMLCGLFNVS